MFLYFQEAAPQTSQLPTIVVAILSSGVLGSLLTLLGVWLQNRANSNRSTNELASQANERRIEREMALRREIYLLGAEALGKMQNYLISLANPLMEDKERNAIVAGVNESLNKVAIIASLDILTALDKLQAHYSSSTTDLITMKMEFTSRSQLLRNDEEAHTNLGQHLAQITAALNAANQKQDRAEQAALIAQYDELDALYKRQEEDLRNRRSEVLLGMQSLITKAIDAALVYDELAAPLNCMVRDELGFPINKEKYTAMLAEARARQSAAAKDWANDWQQRFDERAKDSPFDLELR